MATKNAKIKSITNDFIDIIFNLFLCIKVIFYFILLNFIYFDLNFIQIVIKCVFALHFIPK